MTDYELLRLGIGLVGFGFGIYGLFRCVDYINGPSTNEPIVPLKDHRAQRKTSNLEDKKE